MVLPVALSGLALIRPAFEMKVSASVVNEMQICRGHSE